MTKYMTSVNHVYNRIDDTEIIEADFGPILEHDEMGQVKQYHNTWEDAHRYLLKCANDFAFHLNARLCDMEYKIKIIEAMQEPCGCNLRTKLVGDGCYICNQERAKELTGDDDM